MPAARVCKTAWQGSVTAGQIVCHSSHGLHLLCAGIHTSMSLSLSSKLSCSDSALAGAGAIPCSSHCRMLSTFLDAANIKPEFHNIRKGACSGEARHATTIGKMERNEALLCGPCGFISKDDTTKGHVIIMACQHYASTLPMNKQAQLCDIEI